MNLNIMNSGDRMPEVYAWKITQMWGIGIERYNKTMFGTTHNSVLNKRFRTRQEMSVRSRFCGITYTYTMISGVKSVLGNMVAQVYVTDLGYFRICPLSNRKDSHTSLSRYFMDDGVPEHL